MPYCVNCTLIVEQAEQNLKSLFAAVKSMKVKQVILCQTCSW